MDNKLEIVKCLNCESDNYSTFDKIDEWTIVKCDSCGSLFTNPRPKKEHLQSFYTSAYYDTERFPSFEIGDFINRFKDIYKYKKNGKTILEIGSAKGHFLDYMKKRSWDVSGVEISEDACEYTLNTFGIDVFNGDLLDFNTDKKFDVICMYQVLEHVPFPKQVIKKIHSLLNENGIFIVSVPNINGFDMKDEQRKKWSYDLPLHLTHYTPSLLRKTLKTQGFKTLEVDRYYPQFVLDYFSRKTNLKKPNPDSTSKGAIKKIDYSKAPPKVPFTIALKNKILNAVSYFMPGWRFTIIAKKK